MVRVEEEANTDRYPQYLVRVLFTELAWSKIISLPRRPQRGETIRLKVLHVSPHTEQLAVHEVFEEKRRLL